MSEWITQAQREQLARDLADLPDLVDQLERHYPELLGRGERGGEDPQMRYPARLSVLDLADNRPKRVSPWRGYLPNAAELHAFARDVCGGVRRRGVIQELGGWVRMAHEEMQQDGAPHSHPATSLDAWAATTTGDVWPTCIGGPTVTTEAGWLRRHLDWICGRQWVDELADDMRRLVADLEVIVGPAYAAPLPDREVLATQAELVERLKVPRGTISYWTSTGRLRQAVDPATGRGLLDAAGRKLYLVVEAQSLKVARRPRVGS